MFPSRLGSGATLGSSSIRTELALSIPSFFRTDSRYCHCKIVMEWLPNVILIPTIFTGSPKSVSSHSASRFAFVCSISSSIIANNSRLLTQMMTMMNWLPSHRIYIHGSNISCQNLCHQIMWLNLMFQTHLACFRLYMLLISKHTSLDLSSKLVGCS